MVRALATAILLSAGCSPPAPSCDAAELQARLDGAAEGATVEIGDCEVVGRLRVSRGVTLAGTTDASAVRWTGPGAALILESDASTPVTARALRVTSASHVAVLVRGSGPAELRGLDVEVTERGVGLGIEDVASVLVSGVRVRGPMTSASIATVPETAVADTHATHGIVIVGVADAQLEDVEVSGFARVGALFVDSTVRWRRGSASGTGGVGWLASGGSVDVGDVRVCDVWEPPGLVPAMGAASLRDAAVATERLELCESQRYGFVQVGGTARHLDLDAHDNGDAAIWAQDVSGLTVEGASSALVGNRVAGVIVVGTSSDITLRDATIDATRLATTGAGFGGLTAGDGVHLVGARAVRLENLRLADSARVQIVVDLAGVAAREVVLDGVTVSGTGAQLGLVSQNGPVPTDWDASVVRLGDTGANDAAHVGLLDVAAPAPVSLLPDVDRIVAEGLDGAIMPVD